MEKEAKDKSLNYLVNELDFSKALIKLGILEYVLGILEYVLPLHVESLSNPVYPNIYLVSLGIGTLCLPFGIWYYRRIDRERERKEFSDFLSEHGKRDSYKSRSLEEAFKEVELVLV